MKRLLLTLCIFASTVGEAQSTQQSKTSLFANCWQQGIITSQKSCVAHIYLDQVEAILEILRAPDAPPRATAEATLQAMLSDQLYRQQQKARLYRETCRELKRATQGGDSISNASTDLICTAFEANERADSIQLETIIQTIEKDTRSVVERAKADASAASATKSASRLLYMSTAAVTFMLVEQGPKQKMRLAMTASERSALVSHTMRIYRGAKLKKAEFVLEQSVERLREFLQGDWTVRQ
jgi:hypothetical protein